MASLPAPDILPAPNTLGFLLDGGAGRPKADGEHYLRTAFAHMAVMAESGEKLLMLLNEFRSRIGTHTRTELLALHERLVWPQAEFDAAAERMNDVHAANTAVEVRDSRGAILHRRAKLRDLIACPGERRRIRAALNEKGHCVIGAGRSARRLVLLKNQKAAA